MPASRQILGTACAMVVGICLAIAAQAPPQPAPTFRSDINYVRVDLYPTTGDRHVADLRADEVEVREDGVVQRIEAFEHVSVARRGLPDTLLNEPQTVAQSRAILESGRSRVFVIFLDVNYVDIDASHDIRQPLTSALEQLIGEDDLVGVMTPEMAASDVTFARRTGTIEGMLSRHWNWGRRGRAGVGDRERSWQMCYPGYIPSAGQFDDRGVADAMIERYRQGMTMDALGELVEYLRFVREERKALLVISNGWRLLGPDQTLKRKLFNTPPNGADVGIDRRTGRLALSSGPDAGVSLAQCEADRLRLADLNTRASFNTILNRANRSNVTFYPIDPRGMVAFDTPIDYQRTGAPPKGDLIIPSPSADNGRLRERQESLRNLASDTDGIAIINSNDLNPGMRRIFDDLSSYYLLGYYSTGKADGKFHRLQVAVRRPGVQVRARAGFEAPTAALLARIAAAPTTPAPVPVETARLTSAFASLASIARPAAARIVALRADDGVGGATTWLSGELGPELEWKEGADVQALVTSADGASTSARARVEPGARAFRVAVVSPHAAGQAQVRISPRGGGSTTFETIELASAGSVALVARRGPTTGNRDLPAADLRFRRTEQIVAEWLQTVDGTPTARLLDRNGAALPIPVAVTVRTEADGRTWASARVALAPVAPADYAIEMTGIGADVSLLAFRVVP